MTDQEIDKWVEATVKKTYRPGSNRSIIDLTGQRFGKLTVLGLSDKVDKYNRVFWRCKCDCGGERDVLGANLRAGKSKSCGCASPAHHRKQAAPKQDRPTRRVELDRSHFPDDWMFLGQGEKSVLKPVRTKDGDWI